MTVVPTHPLRCRCGLLQGQVRIARSAVRALCYCRDCQAYARFLGGDLLDPAGGTEVVAMPAGSVRLEAGLDSLACLSLGPRGILRWHARCCGTPIANTPRDARVPYAGVVQACLGDEASRRASFGPVRVSVNRRSARGNPVVVPRVPAAIALGRLGASLLGARLSGGYRQTPLFDFPAGRPVRAPRVLTLAEREQAYRDPA